MLRYDISEFTVDTVLPITASYMPKGKTVENEYHEHAFSEIVLVTAGRADHHIGSERCLVEKGDVLVIGSNCVHAYQNTESFKVANIIYDANMMIPALTSCDLPLIGRIFPSAPIPPKKMLKPVGKLKEVTDIPLILSLVERLYHEARHKIPGRNIVVISIFMEIVVYLARSVAPEDAISPPHPEGIKAAAYHINLHYSKPLSITELSKVAKMSERGFIRHFTAAYGCSPIQYLKRVRVQRGKEMLKTTRKTIGEIALDCGFCDGNHFAKTFKSITNTTPGSVRRLGITNRKKSLLKFNLSCLLHIIVNYFYIMLLGLDKSC